MEDRSKVFLKHQFTAEDMTRFKADASETGTDTLQAGNTGTVFKTQNNYLILSRSRLGSEWYFYLY